MIRKALIGLFLAAAMAGCATEVSSAEPKDAVDIQTDDALVAASEGAADSASRPTLVGELSNHAQRSGRFSRSARYLAFSFDANEGDEIRLTARAISPEGLDPVLILYKATSGGRPSGASIAFNDDIDSSDLNSEIRYTAEESRKYVAVVRRYDRGSSGQVAVQLDIDDHVRQCGGIEGTRCREGQFCEHSMDADFGACGGPSGPRAPGICRDVPDACAEIFSPVCGCDGNTYSNTCDAASNSVSIEHEGECAATPMCPATGIRCTPECPGSGRMNGRPCRAGNFNAATCVCEPIEDCRTRGCSGSSSCEPCWASFACLPEGAVC
ncbi:MAG: hypothetical protein IPK60_16180 [Sandaracinaceae bacterium]|jgi:hypothetical protein|nr:hypothetical protein [Sandaracinaceae bacterium]